MAGGIDWFRWHHGSVTDPKFALVAKRAGASLPEVLAVWAYLLEKASAAEFRGCFGEIDCEAVDCLFGLDDGQTGAILAAMVDRKLIADQYIVAWEKRQPKREREDSSAERTRAYRERQTAKGDATQNRVTPCDATERQKKPRGEESREEETPLTPRRGDEGWPGFADFWRQWPTSDRKQAKGKCLEAWKKAGAEPQAALVLAHVERMKLSSLWTKDEGQYVPAPLVYLNQRRWEGATDDAAEPKAGVFV